MIISPLRAELKKKLRSHKLEGKWKKSVELFQANMKHPSLNVELLEPHWRGVYSFRIDKKYRALFFVTNNKAEVFAVTNHYRK